jgi:hypothetical protein
MDAGHMDSAHTTARPSAVSAAPTSRLAPSPDPSASFGFDSDFDSNLDASHTDATHTNDAALDGTPMERPHIAEAHGLDPDRTTHRHDGSAPAG